jgi:hypothetical protein
MVSSHCIFPEPTVGQPVRITRRRVRGRLGEYFIYDAYTPSGEWIVQGASLSAATSEGKKVAKFLGVQTVRTWDEIDE